MTTVDDNQEGPLREYHVRYSGFWEWETTVMATSRSNAYDESDKEFSWSDINPDKGIVYVDGEELE